MANNEAAAAAGGGATSPIDATAAYLAAGQHPAAGPGPTGVDMQGSMYSRRLHQPGSPESELNHFECFQNYTAPEVFVQGLAGIVNQSDVAVMIRAQKEM